MKERVFEDEHGRKLIVRVNRSNIQIHTERKDLLDYRFYLDNIDLLKFLKKQAEKVWKTFAPKEALVFQSPSDETTLLYQFNKRKMESFIYDMESWFML